MRLFLMYASLLLLLSISMLMMKQAHKIRFFRTSTFIFNFFFSNINKIYTIRVNLLTATIVSYWPTLKSANYLHADNVQCCYYYYFCYYCCHLYVIVIVIFCLLLLDDTKTQMRPNTRSQSDDYFLHFSKRSEISILCYQIIICNILRYAVKILSIIYYS